MPTGVGDLDRALEDPGLGPVSVPHAQAAQPEPRPAPGRLRLDAARGLSRAEIAPLKQAMAFPDHAGFALIEAEVIHAQLQQIDLARAKPGFDPAQDVAAGDLVDVRDDHQIVGTRRAQALGELVALVMLAIPPGLVGGRGRNIGIIHDDMNDLVRPTGEADLVVLERQRLGGALEGHAGFHQHEMIHDVGHLGQTDLEDVEFIVEQETIENLAVQSVSPILHGLPRPRASPRRMTRRNFRTRLLA